MPKNHGNYENNLGFSLTTCFIGFEPTSSWVGVDNTGWQNLYKRSFSSSMIRHQTRIFVGFHYEQSLIYEWDDSWVSFMASALPDNEWRPFWGNTNPFTGMHKDIIRMGLLLSPLDHLVQEDGSTFGLKFGPSLKAKFEKIGQLHISKVSILPQGKMIDYENWYDRMFANIGCMLHHFHHISINWVQNPKPRQS
jgi:hypothetical protein